MDRISTQNFFCTILPSENEQINLLQVGWDKCSPRYTYSNFRDMYIIHIVKSGYGVFETNGHRYKVKPNQAYIVRPNTLAIQTADSKEPWEFYFFAFNGEFAEYLVNKTTFMENDVISIDSAEICELIPDFAVSLNEDNLNEMHNLECLFKLLSYFEMDHTAFNSEQQVNDQYNRYVYTVKKYISFNFSKSVKICDIANQLNINRSHLYRIFKENTGKSIEEYLISVRLNEARRLLDDTDFSVAVISTMVGYSQSASFFKMFKNYVGMTPLEYRNKNIKK